MPIHSPDHWIAWLHPRFRQRLKTWNSTHPRCGRVVVPGPTWIRKHDGQQFVPLSTIFAGRLGSLAEVPLYADSKASRSIQAADFVAWAIWQYYENGHADHLQKLNRRLDASSGVQHGLAHMIYGYRTCDCVPCHSRRHGVVPRILSPHPLRRG